ncbi:MAG: GSCFA domain-containing protein [Bacteroidales bacterium]|nr:GSCFA domain-containing protein [Bacteroidales bacterium]
MKRDSFRTIVEIPPSVKKITYQSSILFMGSCFSDYIGEKLTSLKFPVFYNPFGVLFNPASISENVKILMDNKPFTSDRLHMYNGQWISFNHYTGYSHPDKEKCLSRINHNLALSSALLKKADFVFLTFGTAWVYRFNETGSIVANCHKMPSSAFTRYLLDPAEIIGMYDKLLRELKEHNTGITVVLTLSPVRHWKDGGIDNQTSKSILHYAITRIIEQHPEVQYFPAYEIFMDELRDYRFYATDMLHPSESGIEYTWNRFMDTYIAPDTLSLMKKVQSLVKATTHRPLNPEDPSHKKFILSTITSMNQLAESHPYLDFSPEMDSLTRQMEETGNHIV